MFPSANSPPWGPEVPRSKPGNNATSKYATVKMPQVNMPYSLGIIVNQGELYPVTRFHNLPLDRKFKF